MSITHITLLEGSSNFEFWDDSICSFLDGNGLIAHIYNPVFDPPDPTITPSYQPVLSVMPTAKELDLAGKWRSTDSHIKHVILNKLSPSVSGSISLYKWGTAHQIYAELCRQYARHHWIGGHKMWNSLTKYKPNGDLEKYCKHWKAELGRILLSALTVSGASAVLAFIKHLPSNGPFTIIKHNVLTGLCTSPNAPLTFAFDAIKKTLDIIVLHGWNAHQATSSSTTSATASSTVFTPSAASTSTAGPKPASSSAKPALINCRHCNKCHPSSEEACYSLTKPVASSSNAHGHVNTVVTPHVDIEILEDSVDDGGGGSCVEDVGTINVILPLSLNTDFTTFSYSLVGSMHLLVLQEVSLLPTELFAGAFHALLDSGSMHHIFSDCDLFTSLDDSPSTTSLTTTNGSLLEVIGHGKVRLVIQNWGDAVQVMLQDCLYAPDMPFNILSIAGLASKGIAVKFAADSTLLVEIPMPGCPDPLVVHTVLCGGLSHLVCDYVNDLCSLDDGGDLTLSATSSPSLDLWHQCLGHLGLDVTKALLMHDYATVGELLHVDTCGPCSTQTPSKASYAFAILDEFSKFGFMMLMGKKSEVYDAYLWAEAFLKTQCGAGVKIVCSDGAPKLVHGRLGDYLHSAGVQPHIAAPYAHHQNGKAECFICTLENGCQTLLAVSGLPDQFWSDAILTVHLEFHNLSPFLLQMGGDVLVDAVVKRAVRAASIISDTPGSKYLVEAVCALAALGDLEDVVHDSYLSEFSREAFEASEAHFTNIISLGQPRPLILIATSFGYSKPPNTYFEACKHHDWPVWWAAMKQEYNSLIKMNTFTPVHLPDGCFVIDVCWVYAYKYDDLCTPKEGDEKGHLVAKGYSQRPEDYGKTYAPVAKLASIRVVLSLAAVLGLELFGWDCKTAFLHAWLSQDIFICQLPGFPLDNLTLVLNLNVALYGLHQAAYEFYQLILAVMLSIGMRRCEVDHVFFYGVWDSPPHPSIPMPEDGSPLHLFVPTHFDDRLTAASNKELYAWFISKLQEQLTIVDLGAVQLYLSCRIICDCAQGLIWLSQEAFIAELLEDWNMSSASPQSIPLDWQLSELKPALPGSVPSVSDDDLKVQYQSLVGSLLYLTICTHPNITYVCMTLGQHNANPTRTHLLAAKGVLCYLVSTCCHGMVFGWKSDELPVAIQGTDKALLASVSSFLGAASHALEATLTLTMASSQGLEHAFPQYFVLPGLENVPPFQSTPLSTTINFASYLRLSSESQEALEVHIAAVGLETRCYNYSTVSQIPPFAVQLKVLTVFMFADNALQLIAQLDLHIPEQDGRDIQSKVAIQWSDKKTIHSKTHAGIQFICQTHYYQCQCGTDNTAGTHASKKRQMSWANVGCLFWAKLDMFHNHSTKVWAGTKWPGLLGDKSSCYWLTVYDSCSLYCTIAHKQGVYQQSAAEDNLDTWFCSVQPLPPLPKLLSARLHYQPQTETSQFEIILATPKMKHAAWEHAHKKQVLMDLTFGFLLARALLLILLTLNDQGTGIPIAFIVFTAQETAWAVHADYNSSVLTWLLGIFKTQMGCNAEGGEFTIAVANTDNNAHECLALSAHWPDTLLILCAFHILQSWRNGLLQYLQPVPKGVLQKAVHTWLCKLLHSLLHNLDTYSDACQSFNNELAFWTEQSKQSGSPALQAKGALKFLKYLESYIKSEAYWLSWLPAGASEAATSGFLQITMLLSRLFSRSCHLQCTCT
ncbi:hypothetical protein NP233_g6934 [Leucocoprinus birnbaumii]|uniref:Integrase catalytic domain-containing protein n=1 Tax=Leucocoprinus birnbaumii TaxID=56174 RepID=A0AAD5YV96_9AGAR|nr:hypothetical protein NP233_g6934 [Leucocoprinus birnbaumii]